MTKHLVLIVSFFSVFFFFSCEEEDVYYKDIYEKYWLSRVEILCDSLTYKEGISEFSTAVDTFILDNEILLYENFQDKPEFSDSLFNYKMHDRLPGKETPLYTGIQGSPFYQYITGDTLYRHAYPNFFEQKVIGNYNSNQFKSKGERVIYSSFLSENSKIYIFGGYTFSTDFKTYLIQTQLLNFSDKVSTYLMNIKNDRLLSIVEVGLDIHVGKYTIRTQTRTNGEVLMTTTEYFSDEENKEELVGATGSLPKNKVLYTQFYVDKNGYVQFITP